jgi:hypothetical protein
MQATELMIQYYDIITVIPNSFLKQLREYNVEQSNNGQNKVN